MNCKQGDLAFIKKSLRPENTGLIVTCSEYLGYYLANDTIEISGEHWGAPVSDNYWRVTTTSNSLSTMFGKSTSGYIPDLWLTPIKADNLDIEEDKKVLENV
jgi:hypothetical protein